LKGYVHNDEGDIWALAGFFAAYILLSVIEAVTGNDRAWHEAQKVKHQYKGRITAMKRRLGLALLLAASNPIFATKVFGADDWITVNKDYSSQRYVDLDQITPRNLHGLKEICEIQLNQPTTFSSGLLKVGRTLYVTTNRLTVAFDATTCKLRWRHVLDFKQRPIGAGSRGPGYLEGKIFRGTPDGRLIALDASSGQLLWDVQAADTAKFEMFPSAPIAWKGKVFIGIAFSEARIAGRLMAFDADTGKQHWQFETTLGFNAGGGFWATYSLDPETGEVFGGVANPAPDFNRDIVKDDLAHTVYTNSVISVNAATGQLNWHYQAVPRDEHDWDLATAPTLYRTPAGTDMLAIAGKSGRVYGIDRTTRAPVFETPGTRLENDTTPLDATWRFVCPGLQGGAMFNGAAYHPGIGALYVGMSDHCAWYIKDKNLVPDLGGIPIKDWSAAAKLQAPKGWITAMDGITGRALWQYQMDAQVLAGLVPTKGGLLFAGDTHGNLLTFDAANGTLLRRLDVGGALNSGLISYSVDGAQYVAAAVGGFTENPSTVAGPLRVVIYGLDGSDKPNVVTLDRLEPSAAPGFTANEMAFVQNCVQCHGFARQAAETGSSAPALGRQSQLADPELLKQFLATVPPPMPRLYPGLLEKKDVEMIAEFLKTEIFRCGPEEPQSCNPPEKPTTGGTKAWRQIYSVLTSPRCINCHPVASKLPKLFGFSQDYPRQGDDRHPHYYTVLRGDDSPDPSLHGAGIGPPFGRCVFCHGNKNDPATGIPGAFNPERPGSDPTNPESFWALAPRAMAWHSAPGVPFSGPELCAQLKDRTKNGDRDLNGLLDHLEHDPFVKWAFNPGTRPNGEARTTPPISHEALIEAFKEWTAEGAPCPDH
jgi:alcohol dehydrogenase (cytochrome c)